MSLADGACDTLYDYCSANVAASAIAVFAFARQTTGRRVWNGNVQRVVSKMGDRSLGVYFVHVFFLELFDINIASFNVIEIALYACGIFALSYIVAFLLRSIPKIGSVLHSTFRVGTSWCGLFFLRDYVGKLLHLCVVLYSIAV